jgi:hypothetical protein
MIILGAFLEVKTSCSTMENVIKARKIMPARHHHTIPMNRDAFIRDGEFAESN